MGREHAVVENEIDPRPRGQRRELLEQRDRLEDEMTRAVRPGGLEREHNAIVGQQPESILSDRRPEQVAAELFQTHAIRRRHCDIGVEIEARQMGVLGSGREHPTRHTRAPARGPSAIRP